MDMMLRLLSLLAGLAFCSWLITVINAGKLVRYDDPFLVAFFIFVWVSIPFVLQKLLERLYAGKAFLTYLVVSISLSVLAAIYVHYLATQPNSEVASSGLTYLPYVSTPLSLMLYPAFYWGQQYWKARLYVIALGILSVVLGAPSYLFF